jgi:uncharacterized protein (TIGR00369 family)
MSAHVFEIERRAGAGEEPAFPLRAVAGEMVRGERPAMPVAETVGFDLTRVDRGRATVTLVAEPRHWNPMGGLHGGILCDIADAAMGWAYVSTLSEGESFTTVELKINFMRPFKMGRLTAEGYVVNAGRTLGVVDCEIRDAAGRLIARASSTCMTLRPANGKEA